MRSDAVLYFGLIRSSRGIGSRCPRNSSLTACTQRDGHEGIIANAGFARDLRSGRFCGPRSSTPHERYHDAARVAATSRGGGGLLRRVGNQSGVWSCLANLLGDLGLEPQEVLAEEVGEFPGLLVVGVAVVPGPAWVQDAAIDSRHLDGHAETEEWVLSGLGVVQLAPDHGTDHLAGGCDVYTATYAVWTAGPAGIDQVAAGAVRPQPLGEHLSVGGSWQRKERGAEARGERRLDLGLHLGLGTGEFGGITGEEVVGCLRRREGAYGRQHPEGVGGQKEDGRRMNAPAFGDRARYVFQRIGDTGILRQHAVGVVDLSRAPIHHHVLQHGAEADGVPYLGFFLGT